MNYKSGKEDNYTHIKFWYHHGGTMIVSKSAYLLAFKNEIAVAKKHEYLIQQ